MFKIKSISPICLLLLINWASAEDAIDLSGEWRFSIDRHDVGIEQNWFGKSLPGEDSIVLPGSLQERGFGDDPGPDTQWTGGIRRDVWDHPKYAPYRTEENFKMPFWLQPEKSFQGAAWYQMEVEIPEDWKGQRITLSLERPHWETMVWVDGESAGKGIRTLAAPHVYDLSDQLTPGSHRITVRVDNRVIVDIGQNSHSITDHTQSNWNGLVGQLELKASPPVWIDDLQVYPDLDQKGIAVKSQLGNRTDRAVQGVLRFEVLFEGQKVATQELAFSGLANESFIQFEEPVRLWDEFNPNLYTLRAQLVTDSGVDETETNFGMREIRTDKNRIMINGRAAIMRGTLECAIFPNTGYPPTDVESWKRIMRICREHGLNHIRFHSWCPPKAAFVAADELGFYLQVECSSWPNNSANPGWGNSIDQWLYDEAEYILKEYGNHPSLAFFAYGNEPGPGGVTRKERDAYSAEWVNFYKAKESRFLITSGAGWPSIPENDFHVTPRAARIQHWGAGLKSRINSKPPETITDYRRAVESFPDQPLVVHEIGQWCVYPNLEEIKKYDGVLKPKNFEIFRDFLEQKGLLDQAHDFLMASGKLQVLCYKEEIESNLRTPNIGGFQLLDLHDFPGQGTALVGVLDPFWDPKPYVTAEEYSRFSAPIVPLARLPKRTFESAETLTAQIEVSQFGPDDLPNALVVWNLKDHRGKSVESGTFEQMDLATGYLHPVGEISIDLAALPAPAKYHLEVTVEGTAAANGWDFWVYPDAVEVEPSTIRIVSALDDATISYLNEGGKVLLALNPKDVQTDVELGFSSIFWNTAWTQGQAPQTLGILCDPDHPALESFPTEYHSNWQWSEPIQNAATMELDNLPAELMPIVQIVPDWFAPQKLALAFEAKVGEGALLVCSVNIVDNIDQRPIERQLRHSLIEYMESSRFSPQTSVALEDIQSIYTIQVASE